VSLKVDQVDVEALVREIREEVARKRAAGLYEDARIGRAERHNAMVMSESQDLLRFYLGCLRHGVDVDINDFDIEDRRPGLKGRVLVKIKRVIWQLLKFYTYRLWQQQNTVNGLMINAIESSFAQYERKIAELEARLAALEKGPPA
jgi:hypothetical protein